MRSRKVAFVIDQRTGKEHASRDILPRGAREVAQMRDDAFANNNSGAPFLICAACHKRVWPKYTPEKKELTFSHFSGEGKDCPWETGKPNDLARVDSMRYNGAKEGPDHRQIKGYLRESILASEGQFSGDPRVEENWYGVTDEAKWRRPDVAATYLSENGPLEIAFEIQLSATYLHVIVERRQFYLENRGLLFWIFKDVCVNPRQYQDDIFYNNNSNLFVVNKETLAQSRVSGTFCLECHYLEPSLVDGEIVETWRSRKVGLSDLTYDLPSQRVYFFDCEGALEHLRAQQKEEASRRQLAKVKKQYRELWEKGHAVSVLSEVEEEYRAFHSIMKANGVVMAPEPSIEHLRFAGFVLSAEHGEGVAIGREWTLLQVANTVESNYKPLLYYFFKVMSNFGRWSLLFEQCDRAAFNKPPEKREKYVRWRVRKQLITQKIIDHDPEYKRDPAFLPLFKYLYPGILVVDEEIH